jgi:hypothetical protein
MIEPMNSGAFHRVGDEERAMVGESTQEPMIGEVTGGDSRTTITS